MSAVIGGNSATCDFLCVTPAPSFEPCTSSLGLPCARLIDVTLFDRLRHGASIELQHKNGMTALDYASKAVTESRSAEDNATSTAVLRTLLRWRARRRLQQVARHVRVQWMAQAWRQMLLHAFHEVHFRPGGLGADACRKNFEILAQRQALPLQ